MPQLSSNDQQRIVDALRQQADIKQAERQYDEAEDLRALALRIVRCRRLTITV